MINNRTNNKFLCVLFIFNKFFKLLLSLFCFPQDSPIFAKQLSEVSTVVHVLELAGVKTHDPAAMQDVTSVFPAAQALTSLAIAIPAGAVLKHVAGAAAAKTHNPAAWQVVASALASTAAHASQLEVSVSQLFPE